MKLFYFVICSIILITTTVQAQTSQDTLYVWKAGQLVIKQSIKPVDMDSITFKRPAPAPVVNDVNQVKICSQIWATKNLDVTTYSNGDVIPQVTDVNQWFALTTGAWCYYNNDPLNGPIYGKLYNWYAINDPRGLAPIGWHLPTDAEWTILTACLGGEAVAGSALKETGTTHWTSQNTDANNRSGFTGLPGGAKPPYGAFERVGTHGTWWSSSEDDISKTGWFRSVNGGSGAVLRNKGNKKQGFSVRCLRN